MLFSLHFQQTEISCPGYKRVDAEVFPKRFVYSVPEQWLIRMGAKKDENPYEFGDKAVAYVKDPIVFGPFKEKVTVDGLGLWIAGFDRAVVSHFVETIIFSGDHLTIEAGYTFAIS